MQITPWILVNLLIVGLISPLSAYAFHRYLRQNRREELLAFGALTLGILLWEFNSVFIDVATTVNGKLLWYNVGNAIVVPSLLYSFIWFAIAYSRRDWVQSKWVGVVGLVHVIALGTVLTVRPEFMYVASGLLRNGPVTIVGVTFDSWVVLDRTLGIWFKLYQLFIYVMTLAGGAVLGRYLLRNRSEVTAWQTLVIATGVASPLLANALLFTGLLSPALNVTDVAFGITGIAFAVATFRYRIFRLVPMGRAQLVETLDDPLVMVDENDLVVDSNASARSLTGVSDPWRGMPIESFFASIPTVVDHLNGAEPDETELAIETDDVEKHFVLECTAIGSDSSPRGTLVILRDITRQKLREQRLERQRNDLEVLNTIVRHDIRNDLQLVVAYLDTLKGSVQPDGQEYRTKAANAADDAIEITRSARDVTEILLSAETDTEPISLKPVLEQKIDEVRGSFESAEIDVDGSIEPVQVRGDEMLGSVVRNLLKNAIEHNDAETPEVVVSTEQVDGRVRVTVADNGPGIPPERREAIFEEGDTGLESDGTGLGLYIVKTVLDRYGGSVDIEENEPRGTVFVVELPRA